MKGLMRLVVVALALGGAVSRAEEIVVDAVMVDSREQEVTTSVRGRERLQRLMVLQRWLVAQLLQGIGIDTSLLPPSGRRPAAGGFTRLEQLETFGAALEAMDRGDFPEARRLLRQIDATGVDLVRDLLERLPRTSVEGMSADAVTRTVAAESAAFARRTAAVILAGDAGRLLAEAMAPPALEKVTAPPTLLPEAVIVNRFMPAEQAQTDAFYGDNSDAARGGLVVDTPPPQQPVSPPQPQQSPPPPNLLPGL